MYEIPVPIIAFHSTRTRSLMIESDPERCAQHRSVTVRIIQLTVSDPPERVGMGLTGLWAATIIAASQRPRRARCPDQPKCT